MLNYFTLFWLPSFCLDSSSIFPEETHFFQMSERNRFILEEMLPCLKDEATVRYNKRVNRKEIRAAIRTQTQKKTNAF